ncbi:MAG: hypothetical protein P4L03_04935 [Terracidiphilus sp.]|nr:hypothetical protein [Terracidiphilus sp.]
MSAALQLPSLWGVAQTRAVRQPAAPRPVAVPATKPVRFIRESAPKPKAEPLVSLGFYRKHTESLLRRYLYASMQVGRAPSILSDPISRGWASSRPIRTFEDAVIFVLDVETCIAALGAFDRQMISRIVLQEYTQAEAASMLGISLRALSYKFPQALDRLTEILLEKDVLILPE